MRTAVSLRMPALSPVSGTVCAGTAAGLLAMGPGIAERLFTDRHRDHLAAIARTDPRLIAHDLAAPTPAVVRAH